MSFQKTLWKSAGSPSVPSASFVWFHIFHQNPKLPLPIPPRIQNLKRELPLEDNRSEKMTLAMYQIISNIDNSNSEDSLVLKRLTETTQTAPLMSLSTEWPLRSPRKRLVQNFTIFLKGKKTGLSECYKEDAILTQKATRTASLMMRRALVYPSARLTSQGREDLPRDSGCMSE